jgi:hypothetical protein
MWIRLHTWALITVALVVRVAFIVFARLDSDEPQHLHVAWAWSRGLVQYRDVFDNHFPLLHLLFAPLMMVVPESSSVFLIARLAIAPFAIACSLLLYAGGRRIIGDRAAIVAAIAFSVMPPWLPKSVELRNDTLWIFFWLAALVLITRSRPVLAGIAAGLCLLASVKLLPLLLAHALTLFAQRSALSSRAIVRFAAGAAIPLGVVGLFFLARGALDDMLYATLSYNVALPVHPGRRLGGVLAFMAVAPALALRGPRDVTHAHPLVRHLALFALWYVLVLLCFWPLLTPRDFLPLVPLAALAIAALRITARASVQALVVISAILASLWHAEPWKSNGVSRHAIVDAAVRLTGPDDVVFDLKGDSIFRRRAVFTIYEAVGRALTRKGVIADRGPEEIAAAGCCVAIADVSYIPSRTRAFLNEHFVDAGAMRVCGTRVPATRFTIAVPQTYAVRAANPSRLTIDGVPYRGPRFLAAGEHTASEPVTVVWWRANLECGGSTPPHSKVARRLKKATRGV